MKKYFLITLILLFIFTNITNTAFALVRVRPDGSESGNLKLGQKLSENNASRAAAKQTLEENQLAKLKERAIKAIDNRIASLSKLLTRVQNDKRLSDSDKASLASDIQNAITGLNALKAKIQTDTTLADVKADAKKIVIDYKIYVIFEPKIRLLTTIANLQALSGKVANIATRLQALLENLKSQGKDVSKAQTLLDDINAKVSGINTKLADDKTKVLAVNISSTTSAHQVFVDVKKDLASVKADFAKIRNDIAQLRDAFRINLKKGIVTPKTPKTATSAAGTPRSTSSAE